MRIANDQAVHSVGDVNAVCITQWDTEYVCCWLNMVILSMVESLELRLFCRCSPNPLLFAFTLIPKIMYPCQNIFFYSLICSLNLNKKLATYSFPLSMARGTTSATVWKANDFSKQQQLPEDWSTTAQLGLWIQ